jgi:hypothetical protein
MTLPFLTTVHLKKYLEQQSGNDQGHNLTNIAAAPLGILTLIGGKKHRQKTTNIKHIDVLFLYFTKNDTSNIKQIMV